MASSICGTDAEMFGSLMMFASGVLASAPSSARASGMVCSGVSLSGNAARILPAREMSLVSMLIPDVLVNAWTMGRNDCVASAGASSVLVYMMVGLLMLCVLKLMGFL